MFTAKIKCTISACFDENEGKMIAAWNPDYIHAQAVSYFRRSEELERMSIRDYFQDRPRGYVLMWELVSRIIIWMKPLFKRLGFERSTRLVAPIEALGKHLAFDCQDCGQCVLHYAGMTCPMTCPKNLRNGPCGGVRLDGKCEVKPEMDCVWVKAYERSKSTPYAHEMYRLNPPVDWRLQGTASWVNLSLGLDEITTGSDLTTRYADEAVKPV